MDAGIKGDETLHVLEPSVQTPEDILRHVNVAKACETVLKENIE